jgi:hypothetical protein
MTLLKKILCILFTFAFIFQAKAQYKIEVLDSNNFILNEGVILHKTSFRGLSVVDDQTIWVSGSRGTIARSIDGGKTFSYTQLKGYEKSDFRDIEAFDDKRAIIMSSGTPAYILKTIDGGRSWKEVYKNSDTAYFLDAMDFWDDKRGMLVGDPINGHFVLLQTNDGGETWQEQDTTKTPEAMEGEAVFAASGTSIKYVNEYNYAFVTGGVYSRMIRTRSFCHRIPCWEYQPLQIVQGKNSTGAFSIALGMEHKVIVGGDYLCDSCVNNNSEIKYWPKTKQENELEFSKKIDDVKGYRSCVEVINKKALLACGINGVDFYTDKYWKTISSESFHVVRKAKKGKAVFLAGSNGKIGRLVY